MDELPKALFETSYHKFVKRKGALGCTVGRDYIDGKDRLKINKNPKGVKINRSLSYYFSGSGRAVKKFSCVLVEARRDQYVRTDSIDFHTELRRLLGGC